MHVADLATAVRELARDDAAGVFDLAGPDAVRRHEPDVLIASRDGLDASRLPAGRRAGTLPPGALDVRLDCRPAQRRLRTGLRGAPTFPREQGTGRRTEGEPPHR